MTLREYFETAKGIGVLATADAGGKVNVSVYARPQFLDEDDDETCAFVMGDRLCHRNVTENPSAAYLFIEEGEGHVGKRLSLTMTREESAAEQIQSKGRHKVPPISEEEGNEKYLVHFRVDRVQPLIGSR